MAQIAYILCMILCETDNDETRVESTISMLSPIGMESHFLLNPVSVLPLNFCTAKLLLFIGATLAVQLQIIIGGNGRNYSTCF